MSGGRERMRKEESDEDHYRRFRDGDDAGLEALVRRHARGAARFAAAIVRDAHEGEDVAQESFLKLVAEKAGSAGFDPTRGRFAPFFFRLVRNLALDRIRARRGTAAREIDAAFEATVASEASARAEGLERRERVNEFVRCLPDGERAALVLREFEGLAYRDIAQILGASLETVKVWIFRARAKLSAGLAAGAPEEGARSGL